MLAVSHPPLHVCLLSEEYPPETGWGGIGTYTYNLARGLGRAGHRVTVIAGCIENARTFSEEGVTVHRIGFAPPVQPLKKYPYRLFQAYAKTTPFYRKKMEFARAAWGLVKQLQHSETPVDILETSEYDGNAHFIARSNLVPLVVKIHTPLILNYRLNKLAVDRDVIRCDRMERGQVARARGLTTPSHKMAELAREWIGSRDIRVVPNPIDTDEFSPEGACRPEGPYFFYTGRLEKRKGVHLLIQAFRRVCHRQPDIRLVLAGHDTPTFTLNGKAVFFQEFMDATGMLEGIADRVEFLGKVDRRQLPPLYRGSLACVFPSETFENFPYSCLEAMSCGKAAIVSDSGGMAEMVQPDRSGQIVPAGEIDALAEAMLALAASPGAARRMGEAARQRVLEEYSMDRMTAATLAFYREVLGR